MTRALFATFLCILTTACSRTPGSPEPTPPEVLTHLRSAKSFIDEFRFEECLQRLSNVDAHIAASPASRATATAHQYRAICHQRLFQFPEAVTAYLKARQAAASAGDKLLASTAAHNLSNLHLQAFALRPALAAAEDAISLFPPGGPPQTRLRMEIHHARLLARTTGVAGAMERFRTLLDRAALLGDASLEAWVWESLGTESLAAGALAEADRSLSNAFRIRSLTADPEAAMTLWWIGELRIKQGRPDAALDIFDAAARRGRHLAYLLTEWREPFMRAVALRQLGRPAESLAQFRAAAQAVERSRLHLLQADAWRVDLASRVDEVFDAYVELLLETDPSRDIGELARAVLGRRAVTLRTDPGWTRRLRRLLPGEYWSTLSRLQFLRTRLLQSPTAALELELERTRARLAEIESSAGAPPMLSPRDGREKLAGLPPDRAVLAFHSGKTSSLVLAGTASAGWRMAPLASTADVQRQIREFAAAVENNEASTAASGEELYRSLFGSLPADTLARKHWTLVLDEDLFRAPLAALVSSRAAGRVRYLAESHSIRLAPGLWEEAAPPQPPPATHLPVFLGVGDPVYNAADPRFQAKSNSASSPVPAVEMPRLPGSGREVQACADLFRERSLLTGPQATLDRLALALERQSPDVLHIATHALAAPDAPQETLLALSLGPSGNPELVSPEWIAARPKAPRLVVMSGCRSGRGQIRPGEGLMGLTRAWLYAGSEAVIATYWPTVDDSGELAAEFYRQWGGINGTAISPEEALRRAQIAMISLGGWRAEPRYWGAYFVSSAGK